METPCSTTAHESASLADLTSRPGYFERVSETVHRIAQAADPAQALALLREAAELMGADSAAFGSFIRDDPSHESYRFLLACDPVWCLEYGKRAWYADDPWLRYALRHSEPARASEIAIETAEQRSIVDLAREFGVLSAAIIPAPSGGRITRVGVLCLGSKRAGFFENEGFISLKIAARSLAMELHEWWIDRIKKDLLVARRITDDDIALLLREHLGQSTKRIAQDLDVSQSSIDSRFQRLNAKLGVPNRSAAANLAVEYGLF